MPARPPLQVLGGKHMVPEAAVSVLGEPPFHATALTSSGALSYVGGNWERDIAFAGYAIPLAVSADCRAQRACLGMGRSVQSCRPSARMHGSSAPACPSEPTGSSPATPTLGPPCHALPLLCRATSRPPRCSTASRAWTPRAGSG